MLIGKAEIAFHNVTGTYSGSLAALTTLPANIASGEADGHKFSILSSSREAGPTVLTSERQLQWSCKASAFPPECLLAKVARCRHAQPSAHQTQSRVG